MLCLLFCTYEILTESTTILNAVSYSFEIWINNLFPSLFPFFVLSELLINYGFIELISELFKPLFTKIFKINKNAAFVFFMSMISGFPSNAKYTHELIKQDKLTCKEATKILMFSHFSNPLFILGTITVSFLNDVTLGIIVMICHYTSNIIIGIIVRNYNPTMSQKVNFSLQSALVKMHKKRINNDIKFGGILSNAIISSINTLLLILGVVSIFLIITTIIDNNFDLSLYTKTFISSILEITQGLKHVSLLDIPNKLKALIIIAIISFGGLSVHVQMISIISKSQIKYLPFLLARILHVIIATTLFVIMDILHLIP